MYTVKITPYRYGLSKIMHRQTRGEKLLSLDGRYRFFIDNGTDSDIKEADFWVVQGKGVRDDLQCRVAPANTIHLATEPASVLRYPKQYLRQFGLVYTCQEQVSMPNVKYGPAVLPWFVGYVPTKDGYAYTLNYDKLKASTGNNKSKLISVITSDKAFTQGHIDRIRFVEKLKEHFGDSIDVFGSGIRQFADKWEVLKPYKYHVVIENSSEMYYWTEKISDCFLAETYPFYYGCTNLADYFPSAAFRPIDIKQPDKAFRIIDDAIAKQTFEHRTQELAQCRDLVLDRYNMFEMIARLCDDLDAHAAKEQVRIKPCRSMQEWHNFCNYTFLRSFYKMKLAMGGNKLKG